MFELLAIERESELEESAANLSEYSFKELEKRNLAITKLFTKKVSTGVYGRVLLTCTRGHPNSTKEEEPDSKVRTFSPGDIVGLFQSGKQGNGSDDSCEGIVYKVNNFELTIAFNQMYDFENMK